MINIHLDLAGGTYSSVHVLVGAYLVTSESRVGSADSIPIITHTTPTLSAYKRILWVPARGTYPSVHVLVGALKKK